MDGNKTELAPIGRGGPARRRSAADAGSGRDQRSRLLIAIIEAVAKDGYIRAKIGEIAGLAGVSRATFYELFNDKEACFLAAHREHAAQLIAHVSAAVTQSDAATCARESITALVDFADREPRVFTFLTHAATVAGPRAQVERDRLLSELNAELERAWNRIPDGNPVPDIPTELLLGGIVRTLNVGIRRGIHEPEGALIEWMELYHVHASRRKWTAVNPVPKLTGDADDDIVLGPLAPRPLPRGRHRLPEPVVRRIQRERILHATAEVISAKGYASTTVADIVTAAGVSREVFYANIADKRAALVEASKLFFEQSVAVMAGAFFTSSGGWPGQVWESGRALGNFLAAAPSFAHLVFIESYAPDLASARLTDDLFLGFGMFLEGGYRFRAESTPIPRLVSDAITNAIVEAGVSYIRAGRVAELPGLLAVTTFVTLAPFTGVDFANEFVEDRLGEIQACEASAGT